MANPLASWFGPRLSDVGARTRLPRVNVTVEFVGGETSFTFAAVFPGQTFPAGPVLALAVPRQDTLIRSAVCTRGSNPGEVIVSGVCAAHGAGNSIFDVYLLQVG